MAFFYMLLRVFEFLPFFVIWCPICVPLCIPATHFAPLRPLTPEGGVQLGWTTPSVGPLFHRQSAEGRARIVSRFFGRFWVGFGWVGEPPPPRVFGA